MDEEGFPAREVDLPHPGLGQHRQPALGLVQRQQERGLGRVEAESAFIQMLVLTFNASLSLPTLVIALPREVEVDTLRSPDPDLLLATILSPVPDNTQPQQLAQEPPQQLPQSVQHPKHDEMWISTAVTRVTKEL